MTELWWVVETPGGQLLPRTFSHDRDVAIRWAEEPSIKWPALEADGYRVVQVEVRRAEDGPSAEALQAQMDEYGEGVAWADKETE